MTTTKKIRAKYTTDFGIRIYAPKPGKNYWRISYVDLDGKLRDTTATSEKTALDKSAEIEVLLRNNVGNLPHNPVSAIYFKTNCQLVIIHFSYIVFGMKPESESICLDITH